MHCGGVTKATEAMFWRDGRFWVCKACGRTGLKQRQVHKTNGKPVRIPVYGERGKDRYIVVCYALISPVDLHLRHYKWRRNHAYVYRQTWFLFPDGVRRRVNVFLHREILGLAPGNKLEGHHRDDDPLNNQRWNLRRVTRSENEKHKQKPSERRSNSFAKPTE